MRNLTNVKKKCRLLLFLTYVANGNNKYGALPQSMYRVLPFLNNKIL